MTEEQIKNLKVGDKLTVVFIVNGVTNEFVGLTLESGDYYGGSSKKEWNLLKHATLVTPPHTFEVGDTVRIIRDPLTGTVYGCGNSFKNFEGEEALIETKPAQDGELGVKVNGGIIFINIHCIELVKKARQDKYAIVDAHYEWRVCENCGDLMTVSAFTKVHHPDAKAAAEAECARLNAEWRKQQEGGAE